MEHINVVLGSVKEMKLYKHVVKVHLDSQASSVGVSILVELSDLSDRVRGMALEARNSSLENFVANEGPYIAEDLVVRKIFKVGVVERGVSHAKFRLLETCGVKLARGQKNYCSKVIN